jgi:hypothetical protein
VLSGFILSVLLELLANKLVVVIGTETVGVAELDAFDDVVEVVL